MKFIKYADPQHGWLKVPKKLIEKLGLVISGYSYERNNHYYLEEDSDMSLFLEECKRVGIVPVIKYSHTNKQSKIRSYNNVGGS